MPIRTPSITSLKTLHTQVGVAPSDMLDINQKYKTSYTVEDREIPLSRTTATVLV